MTRTSSSKPDSAGPPAESRQAMRTRAALLRAARTVFETRGYTNTRIEDITDEAGYSAGSFYSYYPSKEAIFSEVIRSLGTNLDETRSPRGDSERRSVALDSDALERRIRSTNERYFRSLATDGRLWAVVEEAALWDEAPRSILKERWHRFRVGVTGALKQWQADGVIDQHRNLAADVNSLSAMTEWLVTLRRVYGFSFPVEVGATEGTWAWMRTLTAPGEEPGSARPRGARRRAKRVPLSTGTKPRTRDRLVDAGFEEFSANSLSKARVADIARTAGVSVGSFYKHFPSKGDLLAAVLTAGDQTLLFHPPDAGSDVASVIDSFNRSHVEAVRSRPGFWRAVAEAALTDPLIRAIVNEQRADWIEKLTDVIEAWRRQKHIPAAIDPAVAAVCLAALTERSTHLRMVLEEQRAVDTVVRELNDCWLAILSQDAGPSATATATVAAAAPVASTAPVTDTAPAQANRRVLLARRPDGPVSLECFEIDQQPVSVPEHDGDVLVANIYLSCDPYLRLRMGDTFALGEPVPARTVGRVEASLDQRFVPGDLVWGVLRWEQYSLAHADDLHLIDPDLGPMSHAISVRGMPGLTAYVGMLQLAQPRPGDAVLVSGATGAVGSIAGQLALLQGARVVGITTGPEKARYAVDHLGYHAAIDRLAVPNIEDAIDEHLPNGVDVCFENIGGRVFDAALSRLRPHSRVALCGMVSSYQSGGEPLHNLFRVTQAGATIHGFRTSDYIHLMDKFVPLMAGWVRDGTVVYREDVVEGIEQVPNAFVELLAGRHVGKRLVHVDPAADQTPTRTRR